MDSMGGLILGKYQDIIEVHGHATIQAIAKQVTIWQKRQKPPFSVLWEEANRL
jgi:hypothetical protein